MTAVDALCRRCRGLCCRYLAMPLDDPDTPGDFDDIRWYLAHEKVEVFVEEGDWYIQFNTRCKRLDSKNRCTMYERRPRICRGYKTQDCEMTGDDYQYDHYFKTAEQLEEFARKFLRQKYNRKRRSSKSRARR